MKPKNAIFYPGCFYHIYNRGNNRENLFYKQENYHYFLRRYNYYLNEFLQTYAYCLLPNHFHLLIKVRDEKDLPGFKNLEGLSYQISKKFSDFFNSYAKAINKQENRVGSLFQKPFKRIHIDNYKYLLTVLYYIHANPQLHGLINDFRNWPYSSYGKFLEAKKSHLPRQEILNWFGSIEEYRLFHNHIPKLQNIGLDDY
ncbi:MAG: transposase [Calditrichaceae bacterium]|nr:transposase [Calditrichaceae bacterium]